MTPEGRALEIDAGDSTNSTSLSPQWVSAPQSFLLERRYGLLRVDQDSDYTSLPLAGSDAVESKRFIERTLLVERKAEHKTNRQKALRLVFSVPWLVVQVAACAVDLVVSIIQVFFLRGKIRKVRIDECICILLSLGYVADISLRVYGLGPRVFFSLTKWWNWVDVFSIVLIVVMTVLALQHVANEIYNWTHSIALFHTFFIISIISRLVFVAQRIYSKIPRCLRRQISQNKRRLVITELDIDLDMTYVTDRIVAMGVPASKCLTGYYRNPIWEVARYFETFHKDHYKIINCCPEMPYNPEKFQTGEVFSLDIADHTPPRLEQIVEFLLVAKEWYEDDEKNVIAVHCKAGKGRTGSLISAWLLYSGFNGIRTTFAAMDLFAYKRTDLPSILGGKFMYQGVETPSQVRYITYLEELLLGKPRMLAEIDLPVRKPTTLRRLCALDLLPPVESGDRELYAVVQVYTGVNRPAPDVIENLSQEARAGHTTLILAGALGSQDRNCLQWQVVQVVKEQENNWDLCNVEVSGDVRVSLFDAVVAKKMAQKPKFKSEPKFGKEPGCIAFFLVDTAFLKGEDVNFELDALDLAFRNRGKFYSKGSLHMSISQSRTSP